jgi:hypothetical protein
MSGFASYMETADFGITSPGGRTAHIYGPAGDSKSWCGKVLDGPTTLGGGRATCKTCVQRVVDANTETETPMAATRNDITTDAGAKVLDEIAANTERIKTLLSEGKAGFERGAKELETETESLISSLSGKGVAAEKAKARAAVRDALATPLPSTQSAEVATLETQDYTAVEGAEKIVSDTAKRITDALKASMKVSDLAKEIAAAKISLAVRFTDANGDPDFFMKSAAAKASGRAMFDQATKGMEDNEESRAALGSLLRAVQFQHGPARLAYVASLDSNDEEAARWRMMLELGSETDVPAAVGALLQRMSPRSDSPVATLPTGSEEYLKELTRVDRAQKLLATAVKRAPKLDDKEREELKAKLNAAATALIAQASAL